MKKIACVAFGLFAVLAVAAIPTNHWYSFSSKTETSVGTDYVRMSRVSGDTVIDIAEPANEIPIAAGQVSSGTFADARIAESSVTQHEAAIDHDATANYVANEHIDWTAATDTLGVTVPNDVSLDTASYASKSFAFNGTTSDAAWAMHIHPDGSKMWLAADTNPPIIYQFTMSTPGDMSTASYDSKSFTINTPSWLDNPRDLHFNSDASKMYVHQYISDDVFQFSLSISWGYYDCQLRLEGI